jgi:hypothetical protein
MVTMSEVPVSASAAAHTMGGLRRKRTLLDLEQDVAGRSARLF